MGGLTAAVIKFGADGAKVWAPVLGASIAVLSLVVAATASVMNWRRQKREASIKAWIDWSDSRFESRKITQKFFGDKPLSAEQGLALVARKGLKNKDGEECDHDTLAQVGNAVVHILNGLERLATGWNLNVYDAKTLRALGGTTIVGMYKQYGKYVWARRTAEDEAERRRNAFVELHRLVRAIQMADLSDTKRELDNERIRHLTAE
jgi:hypothetical protein